MKISRDDPIIALLRDHFGEHINTLVRRFKMREYRDGASAQLKMQRTEESAHNVYVVSELSGCLGKHSGSIQSYIIARFMHGGYQDLPAFRYAVIDLRNDLQAIERVFNLRSRRKAILYQGVLHWLAGVIVEILTDRDHDPDRLMELLPVLKPESVPLFHLNPDHFYGVCAKGDRRYGYIIAQLIGLLDRMGIVSELTDASEAKRRDFLRGLELYQVHQTIWIEDFPAFRRRVEVAIHQLSERWDTERKIRAAQRQPWSRRRVDFVDYLIDKYDLLGAGRKEINMRTMVKEEFQRHSFEFEWTWRRCYDFLHHRLYSKG